MDPNTDKFLRDLPLMLRKYVLEECPLNIPAYQVAELFEVADRNVGRTIGLIRELVRADTTKVYGTDYPQ